MEDNSFFNSLWGKIASIVASAAVTLLLGKLGCNQFATTVTSGAAGAATEEVLKPNPFPSAPAYNNNTNRQQESTESKPAYREENNSAAKPAAAYRPTTYTCSTCGGAGQIQYNAPCTYCSGYGAFPCTYCAGTGKYYNAYEGMYYYCNGCGGSGILRCTGCLGAGTYYANSYCTSCGGDGVIGN